MGKVLLIVFSAFMANVGALAKYPMVLRIVDCVASVPTELWPSGTATCVPKIALLCRIVFKRMLSAKPNRCT